MRNASQADFKAIEKGRNKTQQSEVVKLRSQIEGVDPRRSNELIQMINQLNDAFKNGDAGEYEFSLALILSTVSVSGIFATS